jgi:ribonuclease P protein component
MSWIRGANLWVRHGREQQATIFIVRRKIGSAVTRNRLRRQLRTICRWHRKDIPKSLVVFCQPSAPQAVFSDLEQELKALLSKLAAS